MIRRRHLLVALFASVLIVLGFAAPASAHAELLSTDPASDAVVPTAPAAITLTFSENVETALGAVRLFDAGGKRLAVGDPVHPAGSPEKVQVKVPSLGEGTFLVSYRVISADSHPVQGSFLFSVGAKSALQPDAAAALAGPPPDRTVGFALGVSRFVVFVGFILLAGGLAFVVLFLPTSPRARTVILVGAVALALGSLASLGLQGAHAGSGALADAFKPSVWRATAQTAFGRQAMFRLSLAATGAALALVIGLAARMWWQMLALLVAPAAAATLAWSGHAHTGRSIGVGLTADLVHLVALSWWLGGLVMLLFAGFATKDARAMLARFSPIAFGCVAAVVLSGAVQTWRQVGSRDALSTNYGRLLLWKLALVMFLLAAAALARRTLHRWAPDDATPSALRRIMGGEVLTGIAVLGLTAGLVTAPPAIDQLTKPFTVTMVDKGATANITVDRPRAGITPIHLFVTAPGNALTPAAEARVELTLPSAGVEPITIALDPAGPNHFTTETANVPFKGKWQVAVIVRFGEFESHRFTTTVTIR